ncbi:GTP-binding protein [Glutamicibacter sp. MNS18]|uniref:GTP-binding protein n=1 Tax=Glutamicibacter sp. MNS18 TaxID=2989817 RepID=UPI00223682E6|nr:GTP-binding protein [Glutamicibacter sp. MNS18]MCW4466416.1 GTP-binding protein [Glutamicibacter sp. MNS18]
MKLIFVSSLESHCRGLAVKHLQAHEPRAIVVHHDVLEGHRVVRRVSGSAPPERAATVLEHGCIGCATRFEILPTVLRLVPRQADGVLIVALPPTWHSDLVLDIIRPELQRRSLQVNSVVLALDPAALEDQMWDRHTLWESGYNTMEPDERTAGEYFYRELMLADTLIPTQGLSAELLGEHAAELREGGVQFNAGLHLAGQLAPHAVVCHHPADDRLGRYDAGEAGQRVFPGHLPTVPMVDGRDPSHAIELKAERPLHPERFREALPGLAVSCTCIRGTIWVANAPGTRIALGGAGPRIWMESTGPWAGETAGTRLLLMGSEHEADQVRSVLHSCQLSDAELRGFWSDSTARNP